MKKISELEPGSQAYILNGRRNGVKLVTISSSDIDSIEVIAANEERELQSYWFDAETGEARLPNYKGKLAPMLVTADHPRVRIILQRMKHREYRVQATEVIDAYAYEPTSENYEQLIEFMVEWHSHSRRLDLVTKLGTLAGEKQDD